MPRAGGFISSRILVHHLVALQRWCLHQLARSNRLYGPWGKPAESAPAPSLAAAEAKKHSYRAAARKRRWRASLSAEQVKCA